MLLFFGCKGMYFILYSFDKFQKKVDIDAK